MGGGRLHLINDLALTTSGEAFITVVTTMSNTKLIDYRVLLVRMI